MHQVATKMSAAQAQSNLWSQVVYAQVLTMNFLAV